MKRKYPLTYSYFKEFEEPLRKRSGYKQLLKSRPEFYAIGNVGNYTLSPFKIVFKDLTEVFQCAVVGPGTAVQKPVIPDHTLLFLTSDSEGEAHFICGLLNSAPARVALYGASVGVQTQRYFPTDVSRVKIPKFSARDTRHRAIAALSVECHDRAATPQGRDTLASAEAELAAAVAEIWEISKRESKYLARAYEQIQGFRKDRNDDQQEEAE
jgi:hypothetical protein